MKTLLALLLTTNLAQAQAACFPREEMVSYLTSRYNESSTGYGLTAGNVVELWVSEDGTTWTMIVTTPEGVTCHVASGLDWTPTAPVYGEPS